MKALTNIKIIVLVYTCICTANLRAQSRLENIMAQLKEAKNDTDVIKAYALLGHHYCFVNTDSGLIYSQKAMELSLKIKNAQLYENSKYAYSINVYHQGNFDDAKKIFRQLIDTAQAHNDKAMLCKVYLGIAELYFDEGNYNQSLNNFLLSEQFYQLTNDSSGLRRAYNGIGKVYGVKEQSKEALPYFEKALYFSRVLNKDSVAILIGLGNIYKGLREYEKSKSYYNQIIALSESNQDFYNLASAYENRSQVFELQNNFSAAINDIDKATYYFYKINAENESCNMLARKAAIYYGMNNYADAAPLIEKALAIAEQNNYNDLIAISLHLQSRYFEHTHQYDLASKSMAQAHAIDDSLFSEEYEMQLQQLQQSYEVGKTEKENKLIAQENEILKNEIKNRNQYMKQGGALMIMFLVLMILLVRSNKMEAKHQIEVQLLNEEIETKKNELSFLNTQNELRFLAASLNPKFIFFSLDTIAAKLNTQEAEVASEYLAKFARLLRLILNLSDRKAISLKEELELLDYYFKLIQLQLSNNFQYQVEFHGEIIETEIFIPPMILQQFVEANISNKTMILSIDIDIEGDILKTTLQSKDRESQFIISTDAASIEKINRRLKLFSSVIGSKHKAKDFISFQSQSVSLEIPCELNAL